MRVFFLLLPKVVPICEEIVECSHQNSYALCEICFNPGPSCVMCAWIELSIRSIVFFWKYVYSWAARRRQEYKLLWRDREREEKNPPRDIHAYDSNELPTATNYCPLHMGAIFLELETDLVER